MPTSVIKKTVVKNNENVSLDKTKMEMELSSWYYTSYIHVMEAVLIRPAGFSNMRYRSFVFLFLGGYWYKQFVSKPQPTTKFPKCLYHSVLNKLFYFFLPGNDNVNNSS